MALVIVLRLVVLPAILVPCHVLAAARGWIPRHPMILMTLNLEACVPTGPILAAILTRIGHSDVALHVSALFLPLYVIAVPTMSMWIITSAWLEAELMPIVVGRNASSGGAVLQ